MRYGIKSAPEIDIPVKEFAFGGQIRDKMTLSGKKYDQLLARKFPEVI